MAASLRETLAARGIDRIDAPPRTGVGKLLRRSGVAETPELRRIRALPSRRWEDTADELVELLTAEYRKPDGAMRLYPSQAVVLSELHDFGGALASVGCGAGKTLITDLAPLVVDAACTLLVIPAALKGKTEDDFAVLAKHWKAPRNVHIRSYTWLSIERNADFIEELQPDLIALDEAHHVRNKSCAAWRRIERYSDAVGRDVSRLALSGTIMAKSLRDFAHILEWTHGVMLAPLPTNFPALFEWCLAVDEDRGKDGQRMAPGALELLYSPEDRQIARTDDTQAARHAVRRRLVETPAFISTTGALDCDASLILCSMVRPENEEIDGALARLNEEWITPSGEELMDAPAKWAAARQCALGFEYVWTEEPPPAWMDARRKWACECRAVLKGNRRNLDTEQQLTSAVLRGEYAGEAIEGISAAWRAIRPSFEPVTVPRWFSSAVLDLVAEWMFCQPGIVWVEHVAFGEALQARTKRPFFRSAPKRGEVGIRHTRPIDGPVIASVKACGTGENLQAWDQALVVAPSSNGKEWEQLLARLHRPGQKSDEVVWDVLYGCAENVRSIDDAREQALAVKDVTGQEQRLLVASVVTPSPEILRVRGW